MKRLALALLLFATPAQAVTHTWWVSPTGVAGASGVDSTSHATTLAWFNANAVAGDTCLFKNGSYLTDIRPTHTGIPAKYIVYVGNTLAPRGVIVRNVTADSLDGCPQCVSVKGVYGTGDASFHSGKSRTAALAGYDSLTYSVFDGGLHIVGRSNVYAVNCSFGDGSPGDYFEYTSGDTGVSQRRTSYVDSLHISKCTFNLFSAGGTNVIGSHGSGYCLFDTLRFTLGGTGVDYSLHTAYDSKSNVWRDCYFQGSYGGAQTDMYLLNLRDNSVGNLWERDTLVQVNTYNNKPLKVWFQTDGNILDINAGGSGYSTYDYGDSSNTFTNCVVKVMGAIGIDSPIAKYNFQGNVLASGSYIRLGNKPVRGCVIRHNTFLTSSGIVIDGVSGLWNSTVAQNIFITTAPVSVTTCHGMVGWNCIDTAKQDGMHFCGASLIPAIPGTLGASDSNLYFCTASPDSFKAMNIEAFGCGCAKSHYRLDAWTNTYGYDAHSHWADPTYSDVGVLTFNPQPDPHSLAISSDLWADGYAGAIGSPSDGTAPTVAISEPSGLHQWQQGEIMHIAWSSSDNTAVVAQRLEYETGESPTVWNLIADGLASTVQGYDWTCPTFTHVNANIRVTVTDGASNSTAAVRPFRCSTKDPSGHTPSEFPE